MLTTAWVSVVGAGFGGGADVFAADAADAAAASELVVMVSCGANIFAGSPALTGLVAEADNAESAFAAPAGMSRLKGTRLTVQTMFVQSFADFEVDSNKTTLPGGNPDTGKDPIIIP